MHHSWDGMISIMVMKICDDDDDGDDDDCDDDRHWYKASQ